MRSSLVAVALVITGATVAAVLRNYLVGQVDEDLARPLPPRNLMGEGAGGGGPFDPARAEYYLLTTASGQQVQSATNGLEVSPPRLTAEHPEPRDMRAHVFLCGLIAVLFLVLASLKGGGRDFVAALLFALLTGTLVVLNPARRRHD